MHISCQFVSNCANEQQRVLLCAARVTTRQEFKHAACIAPGKPQRSGSADQCVIKLQAVHHEGLDGAALHAAIGDLSVRLRLWVFKCRGG